MVTMRRMTPAPSSRNSARGDEATHAVGNDHHALAVATTLQRQ